MPKSKDAFRTISEVADWLETPAHVLRFWESKFTQIKPVKRAGGRRYYRPADMRLLGGIKKLLHDDGLTIKGAQKLLREHGVKHVAAFSQALDEDLIEEAAYEPDAQPEPSEETPATVLSFPFKSNEIEDAEIAPEPQPTSEDTTVVDTAHEPVVKPDNDAVDGEIQAPQHTDSFSADALPAFLRRAPSQSDKGDEIAASAADEGAKKVTIDPVATFVPRAVGSDAEVAAQEEPKVEDDAAQDLQPLEPAPVFHRTHEDSPQVEPTEIQAPEPIITPPTPKIENIPALVKIAPELDSYDSSPGVLSAIQGARRISPALAAELNEQLSALRALRDRMRG